MKDRLTELLRNVPAAHRVVVAIAAATFVLVAVLFVRWVTTPTYTVLYSGLDDAAVAAAVQELESVGTAYRLEAGGSRILVPRDELYATRAELAGAGVGGTSTPAGYELLDDQGLTVSDFRQRVDYQRALEGELARTLAAMDAVQTATVRLVLPEKELFTDQQEATTASVLVDTVRPLSGEEVETVTFLVSSSVEGLAPTDITLADVDGQVLASPGDDAVLGAASGRRQRQTRAFEQALSADVANLLRSTVGENVSVVVRADLNFDERSTEREVYEPDSRVATSEHTVQEDYAGTGAVPGGAVGVDGGPIDVEGGESDYQREETTREYAVDREVVRTTNAPGEVEQLSVALVMDDGSQTGAVPPTVQEVEQLVSAALGLQAERGDSIAVSVVPFPAGEPTAAPEGTSLTDILAQLIALAVLVLVAIALFVMMARRRSAQSPPPAVEAPTIWAREAYQQPAGQIADHAEPALVQQTAEEEASVREQITASVTTLVEQQPEEIAVLLRSWLADRR